jgi:hypothetical protein
VLLACATAMQMLPNLKFLVCGILFCVLLFAAAGAGVTLPESRTHIGEMPEVGRPMVQQSMAEAPPRMQAYMMMVSRRSDETERLREQVSGVIAASSPPGQPEVDAASGTALRPEARSHGNDRPDEAPEVVTLAPPDGADHETSAPFVNVPLPRSRGGMLNGRRQGQRVSYRGYSVVQHHITAYGADGPGPAAAR